MDSKPNYKHRAIVIQRLRDLRQQFKDAPNIKIAFLYLTYKEETSLAQLLGCVAKQLIEGETPTPKPLRELWEENVRRGNKVSAPPLGQLDTLLAELAQDKKVFIIVDALDELKTDRQKLVEHLSRVHRDVKMLFTSRQLEDFEELSKGFKKIEITAHKEDIHGHIDDVVRGSTRLRKFMKLDSRLELELKHEVTRKSDGSFLLARLHLNRLADQLTLDAVREQLKRLPLEVNQTYDDIMERIDKQGEEKRDAARTILSWIVFARRPLSVKEIKHALAVRAGDETFNTGRMFLTEDITAFCCGLVVLEAKEKTVKLVHYTAQDYFNDATKAKLFPGFELNIALVCSTYLCMEPFEQLEDSERQIPSAAEEYPEPEYSIAADDSSDDLRPSSARGRRPFSSARYHRTPTGQAFYTNLVNNPFLSYAGEYLDQHFRKAQEIRTANPDNPEISTQFDEILRRVKQLITEPFKRNFYCRLLYEKNIYFRDTLLEAFQRRETIPFSEFDDEDQYSIDQSLESPSEETKESESHRSEDSAETISAAAMNELWKILQHSIINHPLVDRPSSPSSFDSASEIPVSFYSERSAYKSRGMRLADINYTPLHLAAFVGSPDLIEYIMSLDRRPKVDELDSFEQSPLVVALKKGYTDVISALLKHGATVDLKSPFGHVLLLYAAQQNNFGTVETILKSAIGNRISQLSTQEFTLALYLQTAKVWVTDWVFAWISAWISAWLPHILLGPGEMSSTVQAADDQTCSTHTSEPTTIPPSFIQLLLDALSCDVSNLSGVLEACDISTPLGRLFLKTAFFLAIERNALDVVAALLQRKIDVNMRDYEHQTPLHRATSRNSLPIVDLLLRNRAKVDIRNMDGETAWSANAYTGQDKEPILKLLLEYGANPNVRGHWGVSRLYNAAAWGNAEDVKFLLGCGVNPSLKTDFGWAPLHWAAHNGNLDCVHLLMDAGADLNSISDRGTTPLDQALIGKNDDIAQVLESRGAKTASQIYAD
ncbi:hypothetical protein IL306_001688 [Fusarium sp. DS 682]|nr:hypothetical protein IL306_001688 [Fusarium sp. DS 682]